MAPSFRRDEFADPSGDMASQNPTAFPTLAASSFHDSTSPSNMPNPRSTPPPVATVHPPMPRGIRNVRALPDQSRPNNHLEGVALEPATSYSWGIGNGGAPLGAVDTPTDPGAHAAFNSPMGRNTNQRGIAPIDWGDYSDPAGAVTDQNAHAQRGGNGNVSPRHDEGGYRFTRPQFDVSPQEVIQQEQVPVPMAAQTMYEKPFSFFTNGRKAKRNIALYLRPFDQAISHNLTGDKVRPSSPPSIGGQEIDVTPRASLPLRTTNEDTVAGSAYNGPSFPAAGMEAAGPQRNTWRLQPEPWDEFLFNAEGIE